MGVSKKIKTMGEAPKQSEFKFGQGFHEDMVEIATRLDMSQEAAFELDTITKEGAQSLGMERIMGWSPELRREIFRAFVAADNEAQPEIDKAWASPYPETEDEIEKQIYIFGLMESICGFIKVLRPIVIGNIGVPLTKGKKQFIIPGDIFYGGRADQNSRRKEGLKRRLKVLKNAARKPIDVAEAHSRITEAVVRGARAAVPRDKDLN